MNTEDNLKKDERIMELLKTNRNRQAVDLAIKLSKSETLKKDFEIMRKMKGYCNEYEDVVDDMIREIKGIKKKSYYAK